ncbi:Wiskott-Aldrich syndrome protein member 1 [Gaertneriomyces sp. JEL0708]|nr:Wiskott-Aldrich syndrome protein member 1 [Gaertneriomyces sp. JEL0708]
MTLPKRHLTPATALPSRPELRFCDVIKDTVLPDHVVRQTSLMQLNRTLEGIMRLSGFSNEVFGDLANATVATAQKVAQTQDRIRALKELVPAIEEKLLTCELSDSMNVERTEFKPPPIPHALFTPATEDPSLRALYESCAPAPNVDRMDAFRTDGIKCMKLYSHPEFFEEEWMRIMQKELDEERRRRKERRELKKKNKLQRMNTQPRTQIHELEVKRYNSEGEVITNAVDLSSAADAEAGGHYRLGSDSPVGSYRQSFIQRPSTLRHDTFSSGSMGMHSREGSRLGPSRGGMDMGRKGAAKSAPVAAPPPPPPPPPPPAMSAPAPGNDGSVVDGAGTPTLTAMGTVGGTHFLSAIAGGQFTLRKVDRPATAAEKRQVRNESSDVAAILMRRVALEMSDSEEDDDDDDDDWD